MYLNRAKQNPDNNLKLWYRQPAEDWKEALPLGNGRIGVMVYGHYPIHIRYW